MNLIFKEETHEYFLNGGKLPSVNQLLEYGGLKPSLNYINDNIRRGMDRGKRVHSRCKQWAEFPDIAEKRYENYIDGFLNLTDEDIRPYVKAFIDWWIQYKPELIQAEKPQAHTELKFCGTPDIKLNINTITTGKFELIRPLKIVVEIKTGGKVAWHKYQACGYTLMNPGFRAGLLYLNDGFEYIPITETEQRLFESEFVGIVKKFWEENIFCV